MDGDTLARPLGCQEERCIFHCICIEEWRKLSSEEKPLDCPSCKREFTHICVVDTHFNKEPDILDSGLPSDNPKEDTHLNKEPDILHSGLPSDNPKEEPNVCVVESYLNKEPDKYSSAHVYNLEEALEAELVIQKQSNDIVIEVEEETMHLHVRRSHFWEDAKRELESLEEKEWCPQFKVTFLGEAGADTGGLSREFVSLFYQNAAVSNLVQVTEPFLTLNHDLAALEKGRFKLFGRFIGLALLNGHQGPQFFSQTLVNHILGLKPVSDLNILINQLPSHLDVLKSKLQVMAKCTDESAFANLIEQLPERYDFGFSKHNVSVEDKPQLVQAATKHYMVGGCMEEILSFKEGLSCSNVMPILMKFPEQSKDLFIQQKVQVKDIESIFLPIYSAQESNKHMKVEQLYMFWLDFLKKCQRGKVVRNILNLAELEEGREAQVERALSIEDALQFTTGARKKPLLTFRGSLEFDHDDTQRRVTCNACALKMTIPVCARYFNSASDFVAHFTDDIMDAPDFRRV